MMISQCNELRRCAICRISRKEIAQGRVRRDFRGKETTKPIPVFYLSLCTFLSPAISHGCMHSHNLIALSEIDERGIYATVSGFVISRGVPVPLGRNDQLSTETDMQMQDRQTRLKFPIVRPNVRS